MARSTRQSTASSTTTRAPADVPLIGRHFGETGADKMARALARTRGSVCKLTKRDERKIAREAAKDRHRARDSAPWRRALLQQLIDGAYDLPVALVAENWRELRDLLPPRSERTPDRGR